MKQLTGREDEKMDSFLRNALKEQAETLAIGPEQTERMCRGVYQRIEEEGSMRKTWNIRKTVVVAAAVCLVGAMTAVAAGQVKTAISSPSHAEDFTEYSQLAEKEEQLGLKTKAPEAFSNGYRFAYGTPVYSRGEDEQGNVVKEQQDLSLMYSKENMADLSLNIEHGNLFDESDAPDQTAVHEGITLKYSQDHYRMVPPDYEPSAEEKAQEAAGELVISYGTDRVIDQTAQTLTWEDNGQFYTLLGFDVEMTPEEFYQMAGEIIDAE